jgi:hypothetical protein
MQEVARGHVLPRPVASPCAALSRTAGALLVCLCLSWAALPATVSAQSLLGSQTARAAEESLVGTWTATVGEASIRMRLASDGRFVLDGEEGTYQVQGDTLKLHPRGRDISYQFALEHDQLTLSGGDLAQPLKSLGTYKVAVKVHSGMTPEVTVVVEPKG